MLCRIKRIKKKNIDKEDVGNIYFVKFLFFTNYLSKKNLKPIKLPLCDWSSDISEAKIFKTKRDAEKTVKRLKLKNIEYERVN